MSTTVDQKVVEMRFDNKQFESGVQTSVNTLNNLKKNLDLQGASKGLENINTAASKVNLSSISNSVESVKSGFSALEVMGITSLANITNSAVNYGRKLASAFTVEPIKSGFEEYETQINSVQTILANTESKGTTLKQVNGALDELNHYADMTIYNFTEMTRNIGTFTAAGVDLDTSVSAIKGIANLAAVSGSNSQQASTAMYQLSQALASGTVKLQDWNSVVNAGMGGQVFQDALKETARVHGIKIDEMIKKEGSFRETLKNGWLSSEILTETLSKFTGDLTDKQLKSMGYTDEQIKKIKKMGKTANDAATKVKTFTQLMDTLKEAAQSGWTQTWKILVGDFEEAKKLWTSASDYFSDVLNKQSNARNKVLEGWAKGGGREMALEAITNTFKGLLSVIKPVTKAFREVFPRTTSKQLLSITKGVRDLTKHFILSKSQSKQLKNTFKGLFSVIDIGVTFIKDFAKGIVDLESNFTGFDGSILDITGSIGEWLSDLRDSIKETDLFGMAIDNIVEALQNGIDKIKEFASFVKAKIKFPSFEALLDIFHNLWSIVIKVGSKVQGVILKIADAMSKAFRGDVIGEGMDLVNSGLLAVVLVAFKKFADGLSGATSGLTGIFGEAKKSVKEAGGIFGGIKNVLNTTKESLESWQKSLKADILLKIASAVGVLALSLTVLAMIDPDRLTNALGAITVLFSELVGSMAIFNKIDGTYAGAGKAVTFMIGMSVATLVLASALKKVSELGLDEIGRGFTGLVGLTTILVGAAKIMSLEGKTVVKGAGQMILMAASLKIMASVLKDLSSISWTGLGKGLIGIRGILLEFVIFQSLMTLIKPKKMTSSAISLLIIGAAMEMFADVCSKFESVSWGGLGKAGAAIDGILALVVRFELLSGLSKKMIKSSIALTIIGAAMEIFADVCSKFESISWEGLAKSGIAMAGILALAAKFALLAGLSTSMTKSVICLTIIAAAMEIFADVCKKFGSMEWEALGKAGAAVGGLLALAAGFALLSGLSTGMLASAASLLVMAAALRVLLPVLTTIGDMSWESIAKGLVAIAGVLLVVGAAGIALIPAIPAILALAASLTLLGVATMAVGVGLLATSAALLALSTISTASATAIVAAVSIIVSGLVSLIPVIISKLDETLVALCEVIIHGAPAIGKAINALILTVMDVLVKCAPTIIDGLLVIMSKALASFAKQIPSIVGSVMNILIGIINGVASKLPDLIKAGVNLVLSLFKGVIAALNDIDFGDMSVNISAILKLTGLMVALAALAALVPSAMAGVLGLGVLITELSLVLAAVGGLAQIPGLLWIVNEGGNLLQAIGTAIGQFIGGIVGGIAKGATSALPDVGNNLSKFMTNVTPFINGAKNFTPDTLSGVKALISVIRSLTGANILDGIASFLTGKSSVEKFSEQIVTFGKAMADFSSIISGKIDENAITSAANAGKVLAGMSAALPKTGGVAGFFSGNKDLTMLTNLKDFGTSMADFSAAVSGKIDEGAVTAAANAGKALAEMADALPKTGGVAGFFAGNSDLSVFSTNLVAFGNSMALFSAVVSGKIDEGAVSAAANAGRTISEMADTLPNNGGIVTFFTGDNSFEDFCTKLTPFGEAMAKFSAAVSGKIDEGSVTAAANAGKSIAELSSNLPKHGGVGKFFTGDNKLEDFYKNLQPFGEAMAKFSAAVSGKIDEGAVTSSASAGKALAEMSAALPKTGGVKGFFAGDIKFDKFSANLKTFGEGMAEFSKKVDGIKGDAVTSAANAGKALAEMLATLPKDDSLSKILKVLPENFSGAMNELGKGIAAFSNAVSNGNVKMENVKASTDVIKSISSMVSKSNGLVSGSSIFSPDFRSDVFSNNMKLLGTGVSEFCKKVSGKGINVESAKAAVEILKSISKAVSKEKLTSFVSGEVDYTSFKTKLSQIGSGISEFSKAVSGKKFNPEMAKSACQILKTLMNNISSEKLNTFISANTDYSVLGTKLKALGGAIVKFYDSISGKKINVETATNALKVFGNISKNLPNTAKLNEFISSEIDFAAYGNKLSKMGSAVVSFSNTVSGKKLDYEASTNALKLFKRIANTSLNTEKINAIASSKADIKGFGSKLKSLGSAVVKFSNSVSGKIKTGDVNSAIKTFNSLIQMAKGTNGVDFVGLKSFSSALKKLGNAQVNKFVSAFKNSGDKLNSAGASMSKNLANGIKSGSTAITNAGKSAGSNAIKGLKSKRSDFSKAGESLVKAFANALTNGSSTASKKAGTLASKAVKGARDEYDTFKSAGKYLGKGLAKGLEAKRQSLYDKGASLAKAANKGFTDNEDINSPSKIWYGFGGYMIQGLTNALGDGERDVNKSSSSIAKHSTKSLSSALGRITDMFNADIDTTPTIRPVLDLSDVEEGAGSINSMFGLRPSVGVLSDMQSINTMMSNRQNGNYDLLNAIKGLRKDMSSGGNNISLNVQMDYNAGSDANDIANDIAMNLQRAIRRGV